MRKYLIPTLAFLLLSADPILAASRTDGPREGGPGGFEGGPGGPGGPNEGGANTDDARQRLSRVIENFSRVQSMFSLQNSPEAGPTLQTIQNLILTAQDNLAAGNAQVVFELCAQIDRRIGDLNIQGKKRYRGGSFEGDSMRNRQALRTRAELDLQQLAERLGNLSQRIEAGKNPCATEVQEKVRGFMDHAKHEVDADRPEASQAYILQAKALISELQRQAQDMANAEKRGTPMVFQGSCQDQQAALAKASESYRRLLDRFTRFTEQSKGSEDEKTATLKIRVQEMLDKAKEALATGEANAARVLCAKAEGMLPELHRSASQADDRLSPAVWQRLKAKMEKAGEIVSASGSDKAGHILEKGREHFERAERDHASGQKSRAEVEMDIALKLAAKAVDIARAGAR